MAEEPENSKLNISANHKATVNCFLAENVQYHTEKRACLVTQKARQQRIYSHQLKYGRSIAVRLCANKTLLS